MAECLSDEQLAVLAGDSLSATEAAPLQAHVAGCPCCREALEEWRANLEFANTVKTTLGDSTILMNRPARAVSAGTKAESRPEAAPGYQLQEELHRGAQGVVYRAMQNSNGRSVAIKFLQAGLHASEAHRKRFDREIELVRGLHHRNIIRVSDWGTTPAGWQYYVMDYVAGLPLNKHVQTRKLTLKQVLELFVIVCDAVNYAHQRGVIHRDLKPSNILVDAEGMPRVLDFGLAKLLPGPADTALSLTGQIMGTLPYMSPEQARGRSDQIDIRSDVYSLGVILYQILTGGFPYAVNGPAPDVLRSIAEAPPESPDKRWSKDGVVGDDGQEGCPIDEEVGTILLRTLAKDPDQRYQNVAALTEDISRYLHGQPIEARREARLSVLTRTMARYRAATILACTGLMLIASFTIALGWLYQDAQQQREQAGRDRAQAIKSQTLLAAALMNLGDSNLQNGQEEDALGQYLAALAIKEHLTAANLDNLEYREDLADTLLRLGKLCERRSEVSRATAYYRRYRDMMEQLANTEPQNPTYQAGLLQGNARLAAIEQEAAPASQTTTTPSTSGGEK